MSKKGVFPTTMTADMIIVTPDYTGPGADYFEGGVVLQNGDVAFPASPENIYRWWNGYGCTPVHDVDYFPIGTWECAKSPYHHCVYDHIQDRPHDRCLYCGQPEERK